MVEHQYRTTEEWAAVVGRQVTAARVAAGLDQAHLAELANVSVATLSNLERGKGSTLSTLIAVARALGRTDWLESLAPDVAISPMQMLRAKRQGSGVGRRVRSGRGRPVR